MACTRARQWAGMACTRVGHQGCASRLRLGSMHQGCASGLCIRVVFGWHASGLCSDASLASTGMLKGDQRPNASKCSTACCMLHSACGCNADCLLRMASRESEVPLMMAGREHKDKLLHSRFTKGCQQSFNASHRVLTQRFDNQELAQSN